MNVYMKKTNKMASIGQYNPNSRQYAHIERRVFEDENGLLYVRINGEYCSIDWLQSNGRKVDIYF